MSKPSRNEPCPCGSGKKYKKCCLQKDKEIYAQYRRASESNNVAEQEKPPSGLFLSGMLMQDDELDLLTNSVIDLINAGQFDEAEKVCSRLINDYPEVVDGLERYAMLYEARNEKEKAVEYYQKSATFMKEHPGYSMELIDFALKKVEQLS